ncbi:TonB family protein [Gymnodinialimonas sp. 57CJ19]|uniref:TonB family protein n=1 Tax=Gymnodinialimonas sp. 57CJ19 TaxID=3138498 RepID=UPI0031345692
MKGAKYIGLIAAVALSGGTHLAIAGYVTPDTVELEGGGDPAPARLGASFADMVAGMSGSDRPEVADPVEVADRASPAQADETPDTELAEAPDTLRAEPTPIEPTSVEATAPATPQANEAPEYTAQVPVSAQPAATVAVAIQPVTPQVRAAAARSAPAQPTQSAPAEDVVVAEDEAALTPLSSPRPRTRPEGLAPPPRPEPQPQVATGRPQPPAATGNAAANATRGSTTGTESATATATAPAAQPAPQAGNGAAVANYPGQVLRRISRAGRPRVRHNGADVVISFRISGNGGLAGLSVARSSGNAELDQAGLSIVQRAVPFPPPPAGAQTSFSINFGGR